MITAAQMRAARALLGIDRVDRHRLDRDENVVSFGGRLRQVEVFQGSWIVDWQISSQSNGFHRQISMS